MTFRCDVQLSSGGATLISPTRERGFTSCTEPARYHARFHIPWENRHLTCVLCIEHALKSRYPLTGKRGQIEGVPVAEAPCVAMWDLPRAAR